MERCQIPFAFAGGVSWLSLLLNGSKIILRFHLAVRVFSRGKAIKGLIQAKRAYTILIRVYYGTLALYSESHLPVALNI